MNFSAAALENSNVTSFIGDRLFESALPFKQGYPYAIWSQISANEISVLSGASPADRAIIRLDCYAEKASECREVIEAFRMCFSKSANISGLSISKDQKTGNWRGTLNFHFIDKRGN